MRRKSTVSGRLLVFLLILIVLAFVGFLIFSVVRIAFSEENLALSAEGVTPSPAADANAVLQNGYDDGHVTEITPAASETENTEPTIAENPVISDSLGSGQNEEPAVPQESAKPHTSKKIEVSFPSKTANRAAITAMTNYFAKDVRNADGSLNPSLFHAYSDTGGNYTDYLIYDWQTGIWSAKDENTWHVDALELKGAGGLNKVVSMDVSVSQDYYYITNAEDLTEFGETEVFDTGLTCFWVPVRLVEADRSF